MAEIKLKPCPFCGKKVKANSFEHADGRVGWSVTCWDCYADMGHYDSLEELAKHWNRRASPKTEKSPWQVVLDELMKVSLFCVIGFVWVLERRLNNGSY